MSYRDPTYVVFDGDNDKWAYSYMRGWKNNDRIDFDFRDAHDLDNMTGRAQDQAYVKRRLFERMNKAAAVIVLIGESTKYLYKYVRWELELARDLDLPMIAVNLNNKKFQDNDLCPAIIRDTCVIHIPFKMAIIKYALDHWPAEYRGFVREVKASGSRYYYPHVYQSLGL